MNKIKYPRTLHLPWSPGVSDDDKVLLELSNFYDKEVVITKKMDGENTTMGCDYIHARSLDSVGGVDRDWVKQYWSTFAHDIPKGWRICGENLWAKHSIYYDALPSYFLGFSVWNESNECLSWDDTLQFFQLLGITPVSEVCRSMWDDIDFKSVNNLTSNDEGYVVRLTEGFSYHDFPISVAKYVRKDHVQTDKHWRTAGQFTPNGLKV